MSPSVPFFKYEGLGNDFILVPTNDERSLSAQSVVRLCDRRLGIGADGILLMLPPRTPDCVTHMRVINADGSLPEMCGNGLRCVALHIARGLDVRDGTLRVDTDAGPRECAIADRGGEGMVRVEMGAIRISGDRSLDIDGRRIALTTADAGNPHAVLLGTFARGDVDEMGPRIARHPDFPGGTNVGFAHVCDDDTIDLVVWERGVGVTHACGTGACAAAAVACAKGLARIGTAITVRLPGGTLAVTLDHEGTASLYGPARYVFSGRIDLNA
ncbi:MAG: diaminopimelate epimerase [Myxococcota bacterium]|nr:diaminopimelate epimerase [Myxococcota bacterium]